jgi:putative mRNA 3-end processing factor
MRERADVSTTKLWLLLRADRRLVALGIVASLFFGIVVAGVAHPKPAHQLITASDSVDTLAQALVGSTVTGVTLVLTLSQLVLSQEQGAVGDQRERREAATTFRGDVSDVIERHRDVTFPGERYGSDVDLGAGDALVCSGSPRSPWVESLVESTGAATAGFSGWAVDDSFVYRRGFDEGFVLTDHCDYDELLALVAAVDPEQVYTQHGFADEFATSVTSELGIPAQSLKKGQATLGDF